MADLAGGPTHLQQSKIGVEVGPPEEAASPEPCIHLPSTRWQKKTQAQQLLSPSPSLQLKRVALRHQVALEMTPTDDTNCVIRD